jgi:hypothetical protein
MRTDLDHLPPAKRRELERIVQILTWLGARVEALGRAVEMICSDRLKTLEAAV